MRTTIIPAQITTVEDKIAGSFNMTQILLLMTPVLWTTLVYVVFFPSMKLAPYKIVLASSITVVSCILALRIRGMVIFNWLQIFISYKYRSKTYVFNKNDGYMRSVELGNDHASAGERHVKASHISPVKVHKDISLGQYAKFEQFIKEKGYAISYRTNGKGGLNVAFSEG